ncbi:tetratricopeptide (TPR) repeat protein [Elusimicrobium simillimum]|uniref:tetratricopeptide repeat protein n=1 Tax=Elusimicrobium simillimum TaxID=3143438 RepID=UPI003C7011D3
MKNIFKLPIIFAALTMCACTTLMPLPTSSEYIARGEGYHKDGKPEQAVKQYDKALKINPNNVDAYASRGAAYFYMAKYEEAANDFIVVVENNPTNIAAYSALGAALAGMQRYEDALKFVSYTIMMNPESAEALMSRGSIHFAMGNYPAALADYDMVVILKPSVSAYAARAAVHEQMGNTDKMQLDIETAQSGSLPQHINRMPVK